MKERGEDLRKGSRRTRAGRSRDIRPDEIGIGMRGALNQLPLHFFVFRTEIGTNYHIASEN